jgi:acetylglutamate kinase
MPEQNAQSVGLAGQWVVIKYGGAAMSGEYTDAMFAADLIALADAGAHPVVVHGGGAEMTRVAATMGIEAEFVAGQRRTDARMLEVVMMVLAGSINKGLVATIGSVGGSAVGLCGADNRLLAARRLRSGAGDLGFVGEVTKVNTSLLGLLREGGMIPVIAPVGIGDGGELYNINADLAAGAVAGALGASMLIYMSNIPGVKVGGEVTPRLTRGEATKLIADGEISGGMIPKVSSAFAALDAGAAMVRIIDGRAPGPLRDLLAGAGCGTAIVRDCAGPGSVDVDRTTATIPSLEGVTT